MVTILGDYCFGKGHDLSERSTGARSAAQRLFGGSEAGCRNRAKPIFVAKFRSPSCALMVDVYSVHHSVRQAFCVPALVLSDAELVLQQLRRLATPENDGTRKRTFPFI